MLFKILFAVVVVSAAPVDWDMPPLQPITLSPMSQGFLDSFRTRAVTSGSGPRPMVKFAVPTVTTTAVKPTFPVAAPSALDTTVTVPVSALPAVLTVTEDVEHFLTDFDEEWLENTPFPITTYATTTTLAELTVPEFQSAVKDDLSGLTVEDYAQFMSSPVAIVILLFMMSGTFYPIFSSSPLLCALQCNPI